MRFVNTEAGACISLIAACAAANVLRAMFKIITLLNLDYADYDYDIIPETAKINHQIVTVNFMKKASTLRYVSIQKARKIRVAFSSLSEYAKKVNRNGYT